MYHCVCDRNRQKGDRLRWYDLILLPLLLRPFRCTHCEKRFYWFWWY